MTRKCGGPCFKGDGTDGIKDVNVELGKGSFIKMLSHLNKNTALLLLIFSFLIKERNGTGLPVGQVMKVGGPRPRVQDPTAGNSRPPPSR